MNGMIRHGLLHTLLFEYMLIMLCTHFYILVYQFAELDKMHLMQQDKIIDRRDTKF